MLGIFLHDAGRDVELCTQGEVFHQRPESEYRVPQYWRNLQVTITFYLIILQEVTVVTYATFHTRFKMCFPTARQVTRNKGLKRRSLFTVAMNCFHLLQTKRGVHTAAMCEK